MVFDPVTDVQMHAARVLAGATMAAFIAAPFLLRRGARTVRIVVACIYFVGVLGFVAYLLL
jgi:hypothetical protein